MRMWFCISQEPVETPRTSQGFQSSQTQIKHKKPTAVNICPNINGSRPLIFLMITLRYFSLVHQFVGGPWFGGYNRNPSQHAHIPTPSTFYPADLISSSGTLVTATGKRYLKVDYVYLFPLPRCSRSKHQAAW